MNTLSLTSPHLKSAEVKEAQELLQSNSFQQDYLQGDVDGEFGPETARACKRAKYWLGYAKMEPTFGKFLQANLLGKTPLSKLQKARRKKRLQKSQRTPLRLKALAEARKNIGMKENPPNSNICPISKWWGFTGPWCAMAVSKWYIEAGSKAFRKSRDWAYVPYLVSAAVQGTNSLSLTKNPQPGDIVCFDWDDDGVADHTGLVVTPPNNGSFETIEGNTSPTNNSNGGEVMMRTRNTSDVARRGNQLAFIHVGG
jgi:hypothetical protein